MVCVLGTHRGTQKQQREAWRGDSKLTEELREGQRASGPSALAETLVFIPWVLVGDNVPWG